MPGATNILAFVFLIEVQIISAFNNFEKLITHRDHGGISSLVHLDPNQPSVFGKNRIWKLAESNSVVVMVD